MQVAAGTTHGCHPRTGTDGYFRFTRNPMYLGITMGLAGVALLTGNIFNFLFPTTYAVLMEIFFIRPEEKLLEERFGEAFIQYKQKTRRWI